MNTHEIAMSDDRYSRIDELNRRAWEQRTSAFEEAGGLAIEAMSAAEEEGYERGMGYAATTLAFVDTIVARYDDARSGAERALEIFRRLGDRAGEARALTVRAVVAIWDGELEKQRGYLERALELSRETNSKEIEATTYHALGNHARITGDLHGALAYYEKALEIALEHGFRTVEAHEYVSIGGLSLELGDPHKALDYVLRCSRLAHELHDRRLLAHVFGTISVVYEGLGDIVSALSNEVEALRYSEEIGGRHHVSKSLLNIATFNYHLGKYDAALDAALRGLEIAEGIGLKEYLGQGFLVLGTIFGAVGELSREIDCYMRSLRLAQELGHQVTEARVLAALGQAYRVRGDLPKALLHYFRALEIERACGSRHGEQEGLCHIGEIYTSVEEYEEAERYLAESLRLATEMDYPIGETAALISLGKLAAARAQYAESTRHLTTALERAREGKFLEGCRQALRELAKVHRQIGDEKRARAYDHEYQHITQSIFNEEANQRVRDLMPRFEEDATIHEGRRLGLGTDALGKVSALAVRLAARVRPVMESESRTIAAGPPLKGAAAKGEDHEPALRVVTFGLFRVSIMGHELSRGDWKRKRARDLFKLLLVNHRTAVSIDEIHDKLWGGERDGRNIELLVMNAATHIRKALETAPGTPPPGFSLVCVDGAYMLDLGVDAKVDFLRFKELIVTARKGRTAEERTRYYEEAVCLYHGDFLQEDRFTAWTDYYRQILKDAFLEALEYLAGEHLRTGRVEDAIEGARRILQHDELNENAYRTLLAALRGCGRIGEAQRTFEECRATFRRELGVEPPAEFAIDDSRLTIAASGE